MSLRFYRVHYTRDGGNRSAGFSWHTNRQAAEAALRADTRLDPAEYDPQQQDTQILRVTIVATRRGILQALSTYASHAEQRITPRGRMTPWD